jgi:hypothetical protein
MKRSQRRRVRLRAGLTPSANGARLLRACAADLVLLDANPLDDIRNTTAIRGTSIGGRWMDAPTLAKMVEEARRRLNP